MHRIRTVHRRHVIGMAVGVLTLGIGLMLATPAFAQPGPTSPAPQSSPQPQPCPPASTGQQDQPGQPDRQCDPNRSNRPNQPNQSNQQIRPSQPNQSNQANQPHRPDQLDRPAQPSPQAPPQSGSGRIGRVSTDRGSYRPGDPIRVRFHDDAGNVLRDVSQYRCTEVTLEVLAPGGWREYAELDSSCSAFGTTTPFVGERSSTLPPNLPAGTYRVATQVTTTAGAQQTFYSDPFTVG